MTLHEVAQQIHDISIAVYVNGEKFSLKELETYLRSMMRCADTAKLKNQIVIEVSLLDGRWLATINKYSNAPDGFDYTIPDTREQEAEIWKRLTS